MVSPSTSKKENAAETAGSVLKTSPNRLVAGKRPLLKLNFYLDLKNRQTAAKIESKIKELGGSLEVFLIKEVTHVVTDCEAWYYNKDGVCNRTSTNAAVKKSTAKSLPKRRADAMLERVLCKEAVVAKSPLEQAKQWGITIWTVEKAIAWLDKVAIAVISQTKKKSKVYELRAPYIKFESFDRQTRPVFKELSGWPVFNFGGAVGDHAFTYRSHAERNMTRKTRSHHPRINPGLQPGYCEVCRIEYPKLAEHLLSEKHLSYIKDDANFIGLDSLIDEKANIESFLKIHGDTISEKCDGVEGDHYPQVASNKMRRTTSGCDKYKNATMSPVGSNETGHRLRSRAHCNYYGNTNDDDSLPTKPEGARQARELRSSSRIKNHQIENENGQECWESGRPKRSTCIASKKRYTADERLVVDNKNYYKVEVMSNKLRSSGLSTREQELLRRLQNSEDDKGLIVKFRKMRTSELLRLNNEAENFLFPKREEVSSDEDPDDDGPNTTATSGHHNSTLLLSSEHDRSRKVKVEDDASMDSNYSESSANRKRRRRTHAEAFITDNEKYYKFETPGSRLRYQGTFLPPIVNNVPKNNGDCFTKTHHESRAESRARDRESAMENKPSINLEELQFSFERVPKSEPWYQTFQRQDRGEEYYTCLSDSGYFKPFLLPYEMGNLPPLNPKICISAYSDAKKVFMEPPSASTSAGCSTPDPCSNSSQNETDFDVKDEDSKMSMESVNEASADEQQNDNNPDEENSLKRKKRKGTFAPSKNSRKSPRQHASTLAILSSLLQQRKRKEKGRSSESKSNLPSIPEEPNEVKANDGNEPDYDAVAKKIDDFFNVSIDELYEIDVINNPGIDLHCKVSAVELLDVLENKETEEECTSSNRGRKPGRKKKKKNRTGWPNKNRRVRKDIIIKEEVDDVASIGGYSEEETTDINSINLNDNNISNINSAEDHNNVVEEKTDHSVMDNNKNQSASDHLNHASDNKQDRVETVCDTAADNVKRDSVNVDLEKWENAEKILQAKITNSECIDTDLTFQPFVRVQKLDNDALKHGRARANSNSSQRKPTKRPRRTPPSSPKSPKMLRKPRGRWYRER